MEPIIICFQLVYNVIYLFRGFFLPIKNNLKYHIITKFFFFGFYELLCVLCLSISNLSSNNIFIYYE